MTDDFSVRLRALVDEAMPEAPIDPNLALDVARRRARRTRSRRAAASLAVAAVVAGAAVTVPSLADDLPLVAADSPGSVELAPGIQAATSMATFEREGGGAVFDTGIRAWGTQDRFLFTTEDNLISGLYVGGDDEIELLRRDELRSRIEGPISLSLRTPAEPSLSTDEASVEATLITTSDSFLTLSSPDRAWQLAVGVGQPNASTTTHLVARDLFTAPDGSKVSNVTLPPDAFTSAPGMDDFAHFAVVAHNTNGPAPQFAGTVSRVAARGGAVPDSWGVSGCWGDSPCSLTPTWSPATGAASEEVVLDSTTAEVRDRLGDLELSPTRDDWDQACLEVRASADRSRGAVRTDADRAIQCRLDVAETRGSLLRAQLSGEETP